MEYHPAGDNAPKDECLREVSSCDVYVGIFAWRYGFTPPHCDKSITELEYCEALRKEIPTLIFLLDENADWPERYREQGINAKNIQDLRNRLLVTKWIRYFHSADSLSTEVLAAISALSIQKAYTAATQPTPHDIELQNKEFRRLQEDQRNADDIKRKSRRERIPIPIPERLIRYFQDRDTEILKLKQYLSDKNLKMILVCGRGGMGKSTLIVKLLQELKECFGSNESDGEIAIDSIVFVHLNEKGYRTPDRIIELISRTLEPEAATELNDLWNSNNASIRERLAELFRGPLVHRRCLIILDNLESVLTEDNRFLPEYSGLSEFIDAFLDYDHESTLIATSRRSLSLSHEGEIAAIGRRVQISLDEGLPEAFAVTLLRELDPDGSRGLKEAPDEILRDLVRRCQFIPRTLETLVSTLQTKPTWTLETLLENEKDLARLIENPARELYSSLNSDHQKLVVQVLAVYDKPVPVVAVRMVLPALPVDQILDGLFCNFVVSHDRGHFWLHPLDREYVYSQIPDDQGGFSKSELHVRAAGFYNKIRKPANKWKNIEDLDPQLQEFRHLVKAGYFDDACQILNEIDREYLSTWGYQQQIIELRSQLVDKIKGNNLSGWNLCHLGSAYLDSGDSFMAKLYYEKALIIARDHCDRYLECRTLGNLALAEGRLGTVSKEEQLLEEALGVAGDINDQLHLGRWLGSLTNTKLALGHIGNEEAITNYLSANSIARQLKDMRFEMVWSQRLGDIYIGMGDFTNSKAQLVSALRLAQEINAFWETCQILAKLGYTNGQLGDRNAELNCYEQAHEVVSEMSNHYHQFNVLIWLATKFAEMGLWAQQQNCYEEIQIVIDSVDNHLARHGLFLYLGDQLMTINKEKSLEAYFQALELANSINEKSYLLRTALRLAKYYTTMKDVAKALSCYQSALHASRMLNNSSSEAIVLNDYANLLLSAGEAQKAIEYYNLAIPLLEEMNDKPSQINILNRMGMASYFLGEIAEAIKYYETSLIVAREIKEKESEAVALFNIGDAYHLAGETEKAIPYYKDSLELNSQTTKNKCLIGLGIASYSSGQTAAGRSYFEDAIVLLNPYRNYPDFFHPQLAALGLAMFAIGQADQALNLYIECLKNMPPKEHIYYAIQDLSMLEKVPMKIEGLSEAMDLLKKAYDQISYPEGQGNDLLN
jgi:tetratricopeptide (TPR) repeat protein